MDGGWERRRGEAAAPEGVRELLLVRLVRFVDVGHARRLGARALRLRRRPLRRLLGLGQPRAQLLGLRFGALGARGGGDVARARLGGGHLDDAGGVGALESGLRLGEGGSHRSSWSMATTSTSSSFGVALLGERGHPLDLDFLLQLGALGVEKVDLWWGGGGVGGIDRGGGVQGAPGRQARGGGVRARAGASGARGFEMRGRVRGAPGG